jgi:hypothetical protein
VVSGTFVPGDVFFFVRKDRSFKIIAATRDAMDLATFLSLTIPLFIDQVLHLFPECFHLDSVKLVLHLFWNAEANWNYFFVD